MRINLTKKEIINAIYMRIGFSKRISEALLEDFFQVLLNKIIETKKVKISKFGTFTIRSKNQRVGRNPKTQETKLITKRNVILFKASNEFKAHINNDN
tara:strand:+ start:283 stop:576 length:294 start_codon:yes stop_codon:yes gene_type:complete